MTILLSIWVQIASLFFLLSGIHNDILVIRFYLYLAYTMLLVNACLGSPLWPNWIVWGTTNDPNDDDYNDKVNENNSYTISFQKIAIDVLFWSVLSLYVHGASLVALLKDERHPQLTDDEAALWRMMYRTGGLSATLFQELVAKHLTIVEVSQGDSIPTQNHFYIIYHGRVKLQVLEHNDLHLYSRVLLSGQIFDFNHLGFLSSVVDHSNTTPSSPSSPPSSGSWFEQTTIRCKALSDTKLFCLPKEHMAKLSNHPCSKNVFQALLIQNLSFLVESWELTTTSSTNTSMNTKTTTTKTTTTTATATAPPPLTTTAATTTTAPTISMMPTTPMTQAELYCHKIFQPLQAWEQPKRYLPGSGHALENPIEHLWKGMIGSLNLPWPFRKPPVGLRQTQLRPPIPPPGRN